MNERRKGVIAITLSGALCAAGAAAAFDLSFVVEGDTDLEDSLRNSSLVAAASDEDVTDPAEILAAARADYGRLVGALYGQGHFGPVVNIFVDGREAAAIPPLSDVGAVRDVRVVVDTGPQYRFSRAQIAPLAPETELPEEFAVGEPARSGVIEDAAQTAVGAWREAGRAKADVANQRVVAQHPADTLAVDIDLAPGPVVTFGDIVFRGSDAVRPERLRAIAGFPAGEVYSPEAVQQVANRLRRTGVFSAVALTEAETLDPGDRLDVIADLVAFPPRRIGFGAELSTVDGFTLNGFWLHRNLLGGAERFRVEGEVAGIGGGSGGTDYTFGARFERPATFSAENTLYVEASIERLDEETFTSDVGMLGVGIERIVNDELTISYGLAYRFSRVEDDLTGETTNYSLGLLPLEATYDSREMPLDAKSGIYADIDLQPFVGLNDDTGDGARLTYDARTYLSFGADDRVTLAGRVQGGSIFGAGLDEVPAEYRFFAGGGGSVRGQPYQSLGAMLDGSPSGGASLVGLSGEVRVGVTDSIGVVAFYDYARVGLDTFPGSDASEQSGAGLGLRYLTPIGPIRLDVGTSVMGDDNFPGEEPSSFEVYVGIGQSF